LISEACINIHFVSRLDYKCVLPLIGRPIKRQKGSSLTRRGNSVIGNTERDEGKDIKVGLKG
jgi:hypothetical protein